MECQQRRGARPAASVPSHGEHAVRANKGHVPDRSSASRTARRDAGEAPTWLSSPWALLTSAQIVLGVRVIARLIRTAGGTTIRRVEQAPEGDRVSVIVPALNERDRLRPCLDGLIAQGTEVVEILVVDGGSIDGTQEIVKAYAERDERVQLIDASPIPDGWNGKVWGLHAGQLASDPTARWLLTIDADVRPDAALTRSLLAHTRTTRLRALSVATRQVIGDAGEGLLHPSMLTTLVYRFGIPGGRYRHVRDVQANGQCMLLDRAVLDGVGGFASVRGEISEDVTLARRIVAEGGEVGFYETDGLVSVRMYADWRATWRDWPRSLPMRDRYSGVSGWLGIAEIALVQSLPLPFLVISRIASLSMPRWITLTNLALAITRLGVLAGTRRAYLTTPSSYWLSPLADLPVTVRIVMGAMKRRHIWRGRIIERDAGHRTRDQISSEVAVPVDVASQPSLSGGNV